MRDWQRTPRKVRFAPANRNTPLLRPTTHFIELGSQREVFGRLIQCRTRHAYRGEVRCQFTP
ncbi:hypothetical protein K443DRAFT_663135 [Laccaria amethystina LaAM-08-1]|uniref:Uncharacterized protein n=1 Tax=Laccaria amethystina LaAM-08-1 TaxID=1095629 RepID=A0A0C9XZ51_9AGAR|nr:hypothetical protein K443DRAFT_663135 [Laccaria amethystina LaAM-08-1]